MSIGRVPGATGIQPSIVDAKGDLIVATAADSVDRLAVGANNLVLTADSATTTGLKWAAPDPLTTKGDLFTFSTTEARLGVGANGTVLTADSAEATGLKWAAPASGDLVKLASGTISGTAISFNNVFSSTYTNYWFFWTCTDSDGDTKMRYRVSNADDSTSQYRYVNMSVAFGGTPAWGVLSNGTSQNHLLNLPYVASRPYKFSIGFTGTVDGSLLELINYEGFFNGADAHSGVCFGRRSDGTAYDGFSVFTNGSTMSGTYGLYAYKR